MSASDMNMSRVGLLAAVAILMVGGCANRPELQPVRTAQTVAENVVAKTVDGVRITAEADAWTGREDVKTKVTLMKMTIENTSDHPLRIAYENFALVTDEGRRFSAIPPIKIEGDISAPALAGGYAPIASPGFTYNGFYPARHYGTLYPSVTTYGGPFYYNSYYYTNHYSYWRNIGLPTTHMVEVAFPEGVLKPGGSMSGFLYFEKVAKNIPHVSLVVDLVNTETGRMFAEWRIPMLVEN